MAIEMIDNESPIAFVVLQITGDARQWKVLRCPYCGEVHLHGAGGRDDDPHEFLGGRFAHCGDDFVNSAVGEYRLVEWDGSDLPSKAEIRSAHQATVGRMAIGRDVRAIVWARTNGHCWYCGTKTNPFVDFAVDHVVPVATGGKNDPENLVPCCRTCNSRKQARDVEELRRFMPSGMFWFEYSLSGKAFRVGERVRHKQFGSGVVTAREAFEGEAVSMVRFESGSMARRIVNSYLEPDDPR